MVFRRRAYQPLINTARLRAYHLDLYKADVPWVTDAAVKRKLAMATLTLSLSVAAAYGKECKGIRCRTMPKFSAPF